MSDNRSTAVVGIGIGNVLAAILSFTMFKSILWAFIAGVFGWFYVIYYLLSYGFPS